MHWPRPEEGRATAGCFFCASFFHREGSVACRWQVLLVELEQMHSPGPDRNTAVWEHKGLTWPLKPQGRQESVVVR